MRDIEGVIRNEQYNILQLTTLQMKERKKEEPLSQGYFERKLTFLCGMLLS